MYQQQKPPDKIRSCHAFKSTLNLCLAVCTHFSNADWPKDRFTPRLSVAWNSIPLGLNFPALISLCLSPV